MEWTLTHFWLILALLLGLTELTSGAMIMLALALAAALTALAAALGVSFEWQLVVMGAMSGLLVPTVIWWIRPRFSPKGVAYGTTGTGVERGKRYQTLLRDFDQATGIKINGDFYRLKLEDGSSPALPEGTSVIFETFDGTTAIVHFAQTDKES
ncbi:nodulation efficiency, NfeD-like protein [Marinobacter sp.]|uniref:nodulation efficiency, NfeD-like protein n=1 Tax=Marinobacter sp. TaxID=50741 RepID=UPI001A0D4793|nr:nodulation efficiency, NfeD-like protein [Marinobacter sp.]MBE0486627.1 NfeD family protein [Marinobacter sp.]